MRITAFGGEYFAMKDLSEYERREFQALRRLRLEAPEKGIEYRNYEEDDRIRCWNEGMVVRFIHGVKNWREEPENSWRR